MATTAPASEKDLRRAILCDRKAALMFGELLTECPGDCLAHLLHWSGMYATPLRTRHGWATPTRGDMGQGWPDLTLVSGRTRRIIYAELKQLPGDKPDDYQAAVLRMLRHAGAEVYVWRWEDLDNGAIMRTLQVG